MVLGRVLTWSTEYQIWSIGLSARTSDDRQPLVQFPAANRGTFHNDEHLWSSLYHTNSSTDTSNFRVRCGKSLPTPDRSFHRRRCTRGVSTIHITKHLLWRVKLEEPILVLPPRIGQWKRWDDRILFSKVHLVSKNPLGGCDTCYRAPWGPVCGVPGPLDPREMKDRS